MRLIAAGIAAFLGASALPVQAAEDTKATTAEVAPQKRWSLEFTPYIWANSISGDFTLGGHTVSPDVSFSDISDAMEFSGSFLMNYQFQKWVASAQVDYLKVDSDNLEDAPADGRFEQTSTLGTLAAGYQFNGPLRGSTIDAMLGVRFSHFESDMTVYGVGDFSGSQTITDGLVMIRPSIRFTSWLRLNPTFNLGAGDSNFTYELQPHLQFQITDKFAARLGYRRLYYDVDLKYGGEFKGTFQGLIIGFGLTL